MIIPNPLPLNLSCESTMDHMTRRQILTFAALATTASSTGCGSTESATAIVDGAADKLQDSVDSTSTSDLQRYKVALRGYEIISMTIAGRVVLLPYPGMRILSVLIAASSISARLVVYYIDDELIQRRIEEALTGGERSEIESDGYVEFATESGLSERVYLAPTEY